MITKRGMTSTPALSSPCPSIIILPRLPLACFHDCDVTLHRSEREKGRGDFSLKRRQLVHHRQRAQCLQDGLPVARIDRSVSNVDRAPPELEPLGGTDDVRRSERAYSQPDLQQRPRDQVRYGALALAANDVHDWNSLLRASKQRQDILESREALAHFSSRSGATVLDPCGSSAGGQRRRAFSTESFFQVFGRYGFEQRQALFSSISADSVIFHCRGLGPPPRRSPLPRSSSSSSFSFACQACSQG